jgi:N-acetylglucosaminyl-diphospho-decaprenol L-rhamnosyltransferase
LSPEEVRTDIEAEQPQIFDVSVIIVSWNVREYLRSCIESIISSRADASLEILVVDNASSDGSREMVGDDFPDAKLIASDSNLGFGPANNIGLAHSCGRYVFFVNPDTVLREGALNRMIESLDRDSTFDMVGPRLIDPDGAVQRICACRLPTLTLALFEALYLHRLPGVGRRLKDRLVSPYDLDKSQEVAAISGAAMLARREVIERLRGFDRSFLHTGEDMDLCLRLRQSGSRILYLADAEVVHFGGRSVALASVRAGTMSIISMREYFRRSGGRLHAFSYQLIVQLVQIPMMLLVGLAKAVRRREWHDLRDRVRFAKAVWRWQVSD